MKRAEQTKSAGRRNGGPARSITKVYALHYGGMIEGPWKVLVKDLGTFAPSLLSIYYEHLLENCP